LDVDQVGRPVVSVADENPLQNPPQHIEVDLTGAFEESFAGLRHDIERLSAQIPALVNLLDTLPARVAEVVGQLAGGSTSGGGDATGRLEAGLATVEQLTQQLRAELAVAQAFQESFVAETPGVHAARGPDQPVQSRVRRLTEKAATPPPADREPQSSPRRAKRGAS
jgi:hypothetical protein